MRKSFIKIKLRNQQELLQKFSDNPRNFPKNFENIVLEKVFDATDVPYPGEYGKFSEKRFISGVAPN